MADLKTRTEQARRANAARRRAKLNKALIVSLAAILIALFVYLLWNIVI